MISKVIVKNTLYQILSRVATSGIGFVTTILIARYLGVEAYGDFTKIIAFIGVFYLLIDFGLNAVFLQREKDNTAFRNLFYLRLLTSLALVILAIGITFFLPYDKTLNRGFSPVVRFGIAIFSLSIISQALILSSSAIFQKKLLYNLLMNANIIGAFLTLGFVIFFTLLSAPLYLIISAFVVGSLATGGFSLFKTQEKIWPFFLDISYVKTLIKESLPIGFMLIFNFIYFKADVFLLSIFQSTEDVGIYGISYRIFEFLIALPLFLSNTIYPKLLEQKNFSNFFLITKKYLFLFFIFSLLILIPSWIGAQYIFLIKKEFMPAVVPLRILLASLPLFFMTSILQWILIAKKEQKFLMTVYFFSMIFNIALNFIFIPTGSYIAASLITVVSEGLVLALLIIKAYIIEKISQSEKTI